jgi:hypothetical protein
MGDAVSAVWAEIVETTNTVTAIRATIASKTNEIINSRGGFTVHLARSSGSGDYGTDAREPISRAMTIGAVNG